MRKRPELRLKSVLRAVSGRSLRTKLFASYCVVIVLFMFCASLLAARRVETYLEDEAGAAYVDVLRQVDATVTGQARIYERLLYSIYISDAMSQVFLYNPANEYVAYDRQDGLEMLISSLTSTYEGLIRVRIYDYKNTAESRSIVSASKIEDKRWEQTVVNMRGTGVVWTVLKERSSARSAPHNVLCVAKPYYNRKTGRCAAIISVRIDYDRFFESLKGMSLFEQGALVLRSTKSEEIFYASGPMAGQIRQTVLDAKFIAESPNEIKTAVNGNARLLLLYNKQMNAYLIGAVPLSLPVRAARAMSGYIIGLALALALLGILINYLITRSITKGLVELTGKVARMGPGQPDASARPASRDELQELNLAFDAMLRQLGAYTDQLAELRTREVRLQLKALQDQINPHFLYNTLSNISWMAQKIGADELTSTVNSLARFYRIGLSRGQPVIPIRMEIEHVQAYIEIVRLRLNNNVAFEFELDPEAMDCLTPKTVLQPIVENALNHGFEEDGRSGKIFVQIKRERETVWMRVADDGAGMDAQRIQSVLAGDVLSPGYGLHNIAERIRLYFGAEYGLRIDSEPEQGTRVSINIPARTQIQL